MKKVLLASLIASIAALVLPAHAEGVYAGGAISRTSNFGSFSSSATVTETGKNTPTGFKIYGGYDFTPTLAIEAGFADLGKSKIDYSIGGVAGTTYGQQKTEQSAFFVAAKQSFKLNEQVSLFGKAGVARNHTEVGTVSGNKTGLYASVGGAYQLTKEVALTLEVERFGKNSVGKQANAVSAGARVSF